MKKVTTALIRLAIAVILVVGAAWYSSEVKGEVKRVNHVCDANSNLSLIPTAENLELKSYQISWSH